MAVLVSYEGAAEAEKALGRRLATHARTMLKALRLDRREVSLVLTDDTNIRALNAEWRDEDKATDVLSFPMEDLTPDAMRPKTGPLGDIVLSIETTRRDAEAIGYDPEALATFLLVHGLCHLLGHDHGEPDEAAAMKRDEDRLFALVAPGTARPPTPY